MARRAGRTRRYVFLLLREHQIFTCLMCINHFCMRCFVFENDGSKAGWKQVSGVLRVMVLREIEKKINLEKTDHRNELDEEL